MQSELKNIYNLALFARIVQLGGISRCAQEMGIERTTVSRRLAELENTLGVRLLKRSPQMISVTDAGRVCFSHCEQIVELAQLAQTVATKGEQTVKAQAIRLGAPPELIENVVEPIVNKFETDNPMTKVQVMPLFDSNPDAISGVDLAISWSAPDDPGFVARRLAGLDQAVYAAPSLISRSGSVNAPEHIQKFPCVLVRSSGTRQAWRFTRDGEHVNHKPSTPVAVANIHEAVLSTLAGLGLALLPEYLGEPFIRDGRLVSLFPDYRFNTQPVYLVSPRRGTDIPRATMLRMMLEQMFEEKIALAVVTS